MSWLDNVRTALAPRELRELRALTANDAIRQMLSRSETASGIRVDQVTALKAPTVLTCVNTLSEDFAQIPLKLYRRTSDGRVLADNHPLYNILHVAANPEMSAFEWRRQAMYDLALWGNSYTEIQRNFLNEVMGLWPLSPSDTQLQRGRDGELFYRSRVNTVNGATREVTLPARDVLHVKWMTRNGLVGQSPIDMASEAIALELGMQEYAGRFFQNDATPGFMLSTDGTLSLPAYERLTEQFKEAYQGLRNKFKPYILEGGLKPVSPGGGNMQQAQFKELRDFARMVILGVYRIPQHLASDTTKETTWGTGIAQMTLGYVTYTLGGHFANFEAAILNKCLGPIERTRFYPEFERDALLRADPAGRAAVYRTQIEAGIRSPNEARRMENEPPYEGGDTFYRPSNIVPVVGAAASTESVAESRRRAFRAHLPTLTDAVDRILRREQADVSRGIDGLLKRGATKNELTAWLDAFYREHKQWSAKAARPTLRALTESIKADIERELGRPVNTTVIGIGESGFADRVTEQTASEVRTSVMAGANAARASTSAGKAESIAARELPRLANYIARELYSAAGVGEIRWLRGDACQKCSEQAGRTVAVGKPFVERITHPPLCEGCTCVIIGANSSTTLAAAQSITVDDGTSDTLGAFMSALVKRNGPPPAPVVNVTVEPTPIEVNVPAPIVNVSPTPVTVLNDVPTPSVTVEAANTEAELILERDKFGMLKKIKRKPL